MLIGAHRPLIFFPLKSRGKPALVGVAPWPFSRQVSDEGRRAVPSQHCNRSDGIDFDSHDLIWECLLSWFGCLSSSKNHAAAGEDHKKTPRLTSESFRAVVSLHD